LRILHVAYVYPPTPSVADGITNVVYNVTRELAKRGHEVTVYTSDMLDLHGNASLKTGSRVINGVTVYYLRSIWRHKTSIVTPSIIPLISKKLSDFDVIHIHDCRSFQGVFAYLFAQMKNVPYVFQPHGSYLSSLSDSPSKTVAKIILDKLISDRIMQNASKIIALSEVEAEQCRCAGVPAEKIAIVPNGIDLTEYSDLPSKGSFKKKFGIKEEEKIVLYLGRIHKTKGIDLLVKAYAYLTKKMDCKDAVLVIAGPDDGYLNEAKSIAQSLGVSNSILFTGFISSEDKLRALVDAEVFITPSFYGFPVTFLEACAIGVPIITTNFGDSLEWIDENVGYEVPPTKSDLAMALYRIISDDKLHDDYSKNCRKIVQSEFSLDHVVDKLDQVYAEVTKNSRTSNINHLK
jgi:glycosyltransferase involved in cell wall biosynthesis